MSEKTARPLMQGIFLVALIGLIALSYFRKEQSPSAPYIRQFPVMGTIAKVTFYEQDQVANAKAAQAVFNIFQEINTRFSTYQPDSEISRLNNTAFSEPFVCSDPMWDMLTWCRKAYTASHGAFDITARPVVKLWGMYSREIRQLPPPEDIEAALSKTGLDKVVFDDARKTVRFTVEGMSFDMGGIAKGYAVDKAAEAVHQLGITRGIIDLGGNLYCLKSPPPGRNHYNVGIRNPFRPEPGEAPGAIVSFTGMAIATSGNYERYVTIEGKRYAHIMDVRTGKPIEDMAGVSVIADSAVVSDMLSTSIYINGGRYLDELFATYPSIKVLIIRKKADGPAALEAYPESDPFWQGLPAPETWENKPSQP